jgi:hypothetical protein
MKAEPWIIVPDRRVVSSGVTWYHPRRLCRVTDVVISLIPAFSLPQVGSTPKHGHWGRTLCDDQALFA